jgi:membrane-bound metal-dependent hydrolase YbcI (DUF457 family)
MDIFSHFLIAILVSVYIMNSFSEEFIIFAGLMAVLADFDIFLHFFKFVRRSKLLAHKGISHSYFTALIISAAAAGIFSLITGNSFLLAWMVGFIFYSLHVTLDAFAASKIPLFYPLSKKRFRFFIDRAINPILAMISGIVLLFYLIIYFLSPEIFYSDLIYYISMFYFGYLAYKIFTKVWVQLRLAKNQKFIPGIFPFVYFIYENHNSEAKTSFTLSKKYQFLPKYLKLIETEIENGSKQMEYFIKAKNLSKNYMFFSKWEAIIPKILENNKYVVVFLFLAESYANGRAYTLEVVFDNNSEELVYISDGFGRDLIEYQK